MRQRQPVIGKLVGNLRVMGDQQKRDARAVFEILKRVDHLRLRAWVEGGGGFIGDDHLRVAQERAGQTEPLRFTAREIPRAARQKGGARWQAHRAQRLAGRTAGGRGYEIRASQPG
jgi:hypothetical protein